MYCPVCHSEYPADWKACPKDATNLLKSAQIGKYKIEGMLGVGGMGAVYRATNPDIRGQRVAIKVMNPAIAGAEQVRERFKREAAAVAALRTSHVVKVYDFSAEPDGSLYLVMELLDGHALRDEIKPAPDYMDLARVQMVMDGALKGLAAAHKVGIVHRDLKPENIHIAETDDGEVPKLLDFGIARVRTEGKNLTHTGSLMGTASYMAQEQVAAGHAEIGSWTDVYAMGAILYEMLAGAPAFGGSTITEVLQRVLKAECVPLETVRPGLPEPIYELVARCMSSVATDRPIDAESMRVALTVARLVPPGAPIPPPYNTRPGPPPQVFFPGGAPPGSSPGGEIGILATEGHVTPIPALTPPTGANPPLPATVAQVAGSAPGIAAGTAAGTSRATLDPKPKSKLPLVIGGLAVAGIATIVVVKLTGSKVADAPKDAAVVAVVDAAPVQVADAKLEAALDATVEVALPDFTKAMVRLAAGAYDIGDDPKPAPGARDKGKATVGELWIDKDEVTLETLRAALKSPKAGGLPGDTPAMPARNVSWDAAGAACKALGKRLPTEDEWEIAARTTLPGDASKAVLCRIAQCNGAKLVATKHADCTKDGLCDMRGGVIEWTSNESGKSRIVRGGAYTVSAKAGWEASIQFRSAIPPTADAEVGFRCVWTRDLAPAKGDASKAAAP